MKTVIILSIGNAKPSVAKILSDVLGTPPELVVKLLYCTPSVLFHNVDDSLAANSYNLLSQLGLEVAIQDDSQALPEVPELFDLALYVHKPENLPQIATQLADFLGCEEQEAMNLLLNEPSIVLGGVSIGTANALSKRVNAEVICSNPKSDLYTLKITSNDLKVVAQIHSFLKGENISIGNTTLLFENLSYQISQKLWQRFGANNQIELINQSFQRFEITLEKFDINDAKQRSILTDVIGMPPSILKEIEHNLPVVLHESLNRTELLAQLALYENGGLKCGSKNIPFGKYSISVSNINDLEQTNKIVQQFFNEVSLPPKAERWESPKPIQHLFSRYLANQLEELGCNVETQFAN